MLDRGVSTDQPFAANALQFPSNDESSSSSQVDVAKGCATLFAQERKFSQTSAVNGARTAFNLYLADDARVLRENAAPAIGKSASAALMPENGRALTWQPSAADISKSGDLGYTYGTFELNTRGVTLQRGSYVRVWKKHSGKWKVAFDVLSPDAQP